MLAVWSARTLIAWGTYSITFIIIKYQVLNFTKIDFFGGKVEYHNSSHRSINDVDTDVVTVTSNILIDATDWG